MIRPKILIMTGELLSDILILLKIIIDDSEKDFKMSYYSLGIPKMWVELAIMQAPGLYWINCDRKFDADLLCQQTIRELPAEAHAALICGGDKPQRITSELQQVHIKKLPLFSLPEKKLALVNLSKDINRALQVKNRLFILHINSSYWHSFSTQDIFNWVEKTSNWLRGEQCNLLVLTYSTGVNNLKTQLMPLHRYLDGLVNLQWKEGGAEYIVSWWASNNCVIANQKLDLVLNHDNEFTFVGFNREEKPIILNDDSVCFAEKNIFDGAKPPAEWQLVESNELLEKQAVNAQAATVIFSYHSDSKILELARQVHHLRFHCGKALKIVVREMSTNMRQSDQSLLQACGASIIVPSSVSWSEFIMMVGGVQSQIYTRYVPEDFNVILTGISSIQQKGFLSPTAFSEAVLAQVSSTILPPNNKGVLVALTPVEGLSTSQALSLCYILRVGDIVSEVDNRIYLFLSTCRVNDIGIALKFIFRLPVEDVFSTHEVWSMDSQIMAEVKHLGRRKLAPAHEATEQKAPANSEQESLPDSSQRRTPVSIVLQVAKKKGA